MLCNNCHRDIRGQPYASPPDFLASMGRTRAKASQYFLNQLVRSDRGMYLTDSALRDELISRGVVERASTNSPATRVKLTMPLPVLCTRCYREKTRPIFGRIKEGSAAKPRKPRARRLPRPPIAVVGLSLNRSSCLAFETTASDFKRLFKVYSNEPDVLLASADYPWIRILPGGGIVRHGLVRSSGNRATLQTRPTSPHVTLLSASSVGVGPASARSLTKVAFAKVSPSIWSDEPGPLFDYLVAQPRWIWTDWHFAISGPLVWVESDGERRGLVESLAGIAAAQAELEARADAEERMAEWQRDYAERADRAATNLAIDRIRREAQDREIRDRQHRDHLVVGAAIILGGFLGRRD